MNSVFSLGKRQVVGVPRRKDHRGLCVFCGAAVDCAFSWYSDSPVLLCEEFDMQNTTKAKDDEGSYSRNENQGDDRECGRSQQPNWDRQGLCSDCGIYERCVYPRNKGSVWWCEEYR